MTGAAGRIATAIRPLLLEAGHSLVLCDAAEVSAVTPGERVVRADLRDIDAHVAAFVGADLVVHLGALADERPWPDLLAVNVDGTRAVCEAARLAGSTGCSWRARCTRRATCLLTRPQPATGCRCPLPTRTTA